MICLLFYTCMLLFLRKTKQIFLRILTWGQYESIWIIFIFFIKIFIQQGHIQMVKSDSKDV